jgi:hypothetical protein
MPAAVAIPAAISAGTSIFGGILGSHAANKAAGIQSQAAQQQAQAFRDLIAQYAPQITGAASGVHDTSKIVGENLTGQAATSAANLNAAAGQANQFLNPFMTAGTGAVQNLAQLMAPGGDLNRNFTLQDMQTLDPGYQFRIDQANKLAQQSAAARGGALGGGALQGLAQLNQNLASSEMQNAFSRFQTQQQNRFSNLYNLAGMGQNAANLSGANLMNAAQVGGGWQNAAMQQAGAWDLTGSQYEADAAKWLADYAMGGQRSIADLMTGAANAQAAGTVGAANAWSGMLGGLANTAGNVGNYFLGQKMLGQLGYGNQQAPTAYDVNNLPMGTGAGVQRNPWMFTPIAAPPILPPSTPQYAGPYMPEYMNPGYFGPYGGYPTK